MRYKASKFNLFTLVMIMCQSLCHSQTTKMNVTFQNVTHLGCTILGIKIFFRKRQNSSKTDFKKKEKTNRVKYKLKDISFARAKFFFWLAEHLNIFLQIAGVRHTLQRVFPSRNARLY